MMNQVRQNDSGKLAGAVVGIRPDQEEEIDWLEQ